MKSHFIVRTLLFSYPVFLAIPSLIFAADCTAQENNWYVGIGAGWSNDDVKKEEIFSSLQADGFSISQFTSNDDDNMYKLFGGYNFNPHFAMEVGYFDHGSFDFISTLLQTDMQEGKVSVDGYFFDFIGRWPIEHGLSAFVRGGINNARVEQKFADNQFATAFYNSSERGANLNYGAGVVYSFNDVFSVRAEVERFRIEKNTITDDRVDTFSISVLYHFGSRRPTRATSTNEQAIQEHTRTPTPSPESSPLPGPEPGLPAEITLSASTLFDFDMAVLRDEGKQVLTELVRDMADLEYEVVIITGHTDRIGTRPYNLALSMRRAETVRNYLLQAGIPGQNISARGVNSDEPVTTPRQCMGPVTDNLKACLQPDRRVVVEVTGTRDSQ